MASKADLSSAQAAWEGRKFRLGCEIAAVCVAVITYGWLWSLSTKDVVWPTDHFSDMEVMLSGESFAAHGFLRLHYLPVSYVGGVSDTPGYYLHYPPLPNLLNGLLRAVGVSSLAVMRRFSSLFFVIGMYCMYRAFAKVVGHLAAVCGLAFMSSSVYVPSYGMSLHTHAYNMFFLGLFFLLFLGAADGQGRNLWRWVGCWIVLLLESFVSFEFIIYPQIFLWTYVVATGRLRRTWLPLVVLGLAPLFGVGLHFLQNIWAVGWDVAAGDALGAGYLKGYSRWEVWPELVPTLQEYSHRHYSLPWTVLPLLAVGCLVVAHRFKPSSILVARSTGLLLAAVFAASAWYLLLPAHARGHAHTVNQLFPLTFLVTGGTVAIMLHWGLKRGTSVSLRVAVAIGALVIIHGQVQGLRRCLTAHNMLPSAVISEALGPDALPRNVGILFNTGASAQLKYYIRRPAWYHPSFTKPFHGTMPELAKHLPEGWKLKYYLFYGPPAGREKTETFEFLVENCPGKLLRIPGFGRPERFVILFDISELNRPPEQRRPLDPKVRERQRNHMYPRWYVPGFARRMERAVMKQSRG